MQQSGLQTKDKLQNSLLELGDSLSIAWSEFSKNIKNFLILVLVINLPMALINLYLSTSIQTDSDGAFTFVGNKGLFVIGWLIYAVLATLTSLASHKIIERSILNQHIEVTTILKNSLPQILITFVVGIILFFLIGLGYIFLIIPGIWLMVRYSFTAQAIALRNCGLNSLGYSSSIVKGRWWSLFWRYILLGFCALLIFIPVLIVMGIIGGLASLINLGVVAQILSALISSLIGYYFLAVNTVIFLNFDYTHKNNLPESSSTS